MEHREQEREEECKTGLIPKGRRTKRIRTPFPPAFNSPSPPLSPSSQESLCEHTLEEQEIASYLLLLSNGHESPRVQFIDAKSKSNTSKRVGLDGHVFYECNTCGREFTSFQALGGHRASHKKSRLAQPPKNEYNSWISTLETRKVAEAEEMKEDDMLKLSMNSFSMASTKNKIHQCTVCGSEFASGQALGGHMRRHQNPAMVAPDTELREEDEILKENQTSHLALDLNLPAPLEEKRATSLWISSEVEFYF